MSSTQGPKDERRRSEAEPARTAGSGTTSHDPLGDPRSSATPDGLGALLAALAAPPEAQELAGEHAMVAAFSEALAGAPGLAHAVGTSSKRRRKMLGKVLTAKAAAAAVAAVLLGSGVAAATGSLPASLQMAVHRALGAPAPHAHAKVAAHASAKGSTSLATTTQGGSTTTTSSGQMGTTTTTTTSSSGSATTTTSNGVGPAVPGPSTRGLCVAVLASGRATAQVSAKEPTAFRNLEAAATAKGESVSAYCATVLQGSTTGSSTTSSSPITSSATTTGSSSSTSSPGASGSAGSSATLHAHGSASGSTSGSSLPTQASGNANLGASVSAGASGRAFGRSHSPLAGLAG